MWGPLSSTTCYKASRYITLQGTLPMELVLLRVGLLWAYPHGRTERQHGQAIAIRRMVAVQMHSPAKATAANWRVWKGLARGLVLRAVD